MLYIHSDDFFEKASLFHVVTRENELRYAAQMKQGNTEAREMLLHSFLPYLAACLKRFSPEDVTLELVYRYQQALEQAVDSFDFLQNSEPFSHRLNWYLKNAATKYFAEHR